MQAVKNLIRKEVRWEPSASPEVEGYRLYWSIGGEVHYDSQFAELGQCTEVILPDDIPLFPVLDRQIHVGITAVSKTGNESDMIRFPRPLNFFEVDFLRGPGEREIEYPSAGPRISPVTGSLLFAITVLLIMYFMFSGSPKRTFTPQNEESPIAAPEFYETMRGLDHAIYTFLCEDGSRENALFLTGVQEKKQNGRLLDVTELMVRCPDEETAHETLKRLGDAITNTEGNVVLKVERVNRQRILCRIIADGWYSYKIILEFKTPRILPKSIRPKVAIILDDLGYDSHLALSFMKMDVPVTMSVLPSAPFTSLIVREAKKRGFELMVHLPMEPKNYPNVDPGPGALLLQMDENEIRQVLDRDLGQISGAKGINNHMGSQFTESREKMKIVLQELKRRNLFFVDSLTTSQTVGFQLAQEMGVPAARRNVFLDNDLTFEAVKTQMERLLSVARRTGSAVGVFHPHPETLRILEEYLVKMKKEFEVVPVSALVS